MTLTDLFIIVAIVFFTLITAALIPALLQLKRTIKKMEGFIVTLDRETGPLLQSISATVAELRILTVSLNEKIDKTDKIFRNLQQSTNKLLTTTDLIKKTITPPFTQIAGIRAGLSAFRHFFGRSATPKDKGGKSDE